MSEARFEVRWRCATCGATSPYGDYIPHYFHEGPVKPGEVVVERRSVTPWLPNLPT